MTPKGVRAFKPLSYRKIDEIASQWRRTLGYGDLDPIDVKSFFDKDLDNITVSVKGRKVDLVQSISDAIEEGSSKWNPDIEAIEVGLSPNGYDELADGSPRARYTVAHEFGHAILHTEELVELVDLSTNHHLAMNRRKDHPIYRDTEWQANAFAAAWLMPRAAIEPYLDRKGSLLFSVENSISLRFGVSWAAANHRLDNVRRFE